MVREGISLRTITEQDDRWIDNLGSKEISPSFTSVYLSSESWWYCWTEPWKGHGVKKKKRKQKKKKWVSSANMRTVQCAKYSLQISRTCVKTMLISKHWFNILIFFLFFLCVSTGTPYSCAYFPPQKKPNNLLYDLLLIANNLTLQSFTALIVSSVSHRFLTKILGKEYRKSWRLNSPTR